MLNDQRALALITIDQETNHDHDDHDSPVIRDIHPLTPPPSSRATRREAWDTASRRSSNLSIGSTTTEGGENFTTMSREFNALVLAGSTIAGTSEHEPGSSSLTRISEENHSLRETNPLAIVPDSNPMESPRGVAADRLALTAVNGREVSVQRVKKEEIESKINAWQNAKIAKINNRFKREDAVINGWEGEQVQNATSWMKKIERKLEEKRAKAQEKMQNEMAKAHRKAEERRASAEGKRGIKVAKVLEIANLMKAVGRPPAKRSFF